MSIKRYGVLLKKHLFDGIPSVMRKKNRSFNWAGIFLTLILAACLAAAFVFIFARFTETYTAIKINRVEDIPARQYELMSCVYFILIVAMTVSSVNRLCYSLFENSDINVLISLPFSSSEIFFSRLTAVYIRQLIFATVFVLGINVTFFTVTHTVSAYNVIMTLVMAVILPVIPIGIASVVVLPYFYIKKTLQSHYLLIFLTITLIMIAFCLCYSYVFDFAQHLIGSGKITTLFDEATMYRIQNFAQWCYPANLFASIMLKREIGKNVGILLAILVCALLLGVFTVRTIFIRVSQSKITLRIPHHPHRELHYKKRSRLASLLHKEFSTVIRTPNYAYMYFTTAIVMPVLAFYSAKIGSMLVQNLLGGAGHGFEVCTFILLLYGTLTNTFCSTNISRDGYMAVTLKTLPYSAGKILQSKIIFCSAVSEISVLIACIVFAACKLESPADAVASFVSASMLSLAQIMFATKLDLKHPNFSKVDDGEIKETNSTVSTVIVLFLAVGFIVGLLLLFNTVRSMMTGVTNVDHNALSYVYALLIPLAVLAGSMAYFFAGLKKAYADLDTEA